MSVQEKLKNIEDNLLGLDRNPEHVAAFPAHMPGCTQTKPLQTVIEWKGQFPTWSSLGFNTEIIGQRVTCTECKGSTLVR
ncbi:hypothetical protein HY031_03290 [Candidatus Gottesmanbacteria bacterium]|nr:hypothetical protein [Candidatus Gottesmanbacteria bacterium]